MQIRFTEDDIKELIIRYMERTSQMEITKKEISVYTGDGPVNFDVEIKGPEMSTVRCHKCGGYYECELHEYQDLCDHCKPVASDIQKAFVAGAEWWEFTSTGHTMWGSDRQLAELEATKRYK